MIHFADNEKTIIFALLFGELNPDFCFFRTGSRSGGIEIR